MKNVFFALWAAVLWNACESKPKPDVDDVEETEVTGKKKKGSKDDSGSAGDEAGETKSKGDVRDVVTTLGNEPVFEGSLGLSQLNDALMTAEDLLRKERDNLPLMVTHLALLRMQGEVQESYKTARARAGGFGSKNPTFLVEASYGAMQRREYAFADYLLNKASKLGSDNLTKNAVAHAFGVNAYLQGKRMEGIAGMRKAASAEPGYLPALYTLGYLALKAGDGEGAERNFRSAMAQTPNSMNARIGLAAALRVRGKADEAAPLLEPLYKAKSNDRRIVWNYALALSDGPNKKLANEVLNRYFSLPDAGKYPVIDDKANALASKLSASSAPTLQKSPDKAGAPDKEKPAESDSPAK